MCKACNTYAGIVSYHTLNSPPERNKYTRYVLLIDFLLVCLLLCFRFVIHKTIKRKDLIQALPLPRRVLDYLCYKNCLSERTEVDLLSSLEKPNIVLR